MPGETDPNAELQIGHILFLDIVGYSKLLTNEQRERVAELTRIVRGTDAFQTADRAGKLMMLPTGDGMVLAFFTSPDAPVRCAIAISSALTSNHALPVRMGIHSGPVEQLTDVTGRPNLTGAGVNMAQRVMDCGDAGHILLSARAADDLAQISDWKNKLHSLGEIEVKHGVRVPVSSLHDGVIGNPEVPQKILWQHKRHRRKLVVVSAVAIATAAAIIGVVWLMRRAAVPPEAKSIAVLPFENLSADKENVFFANGVQDEILTRLGKIASLKVISRTSTTNYPPQPSNLNEIAQQLGVAHILEGGVQKVGSKVRVNVKLVKASTAAQLWGDTYDRELTDVFAVESEIASRIASSLAATLTPEEKSRVYAIPTSNPDAYEAYLRGREAFRAGDDSPKQKEHYERAIALDPEFALAYAGLTWWYCMDALGVGVTPENRKKARFAADEALRLQPDMGEGHFALGSYFYGFEHNYDAADKEFAVAARILPNDAELFRFWAIMKRRQGRWRAAIEGVQRSLSLDPRNLLTAEWASGLYYSVRNYAAAEEARRREVELATTYSPEAAAKAKVRLVTLQWIRTGTLAPMQALLDELPQDSKGRGSVLQGIGYAKRDPDLIMQGAAIEADEQDFGYFFGRAIPLLAKGDVQHANEILDRLISQTEVHLKENPHEAIFHIKLGLFYAYRGFKEEAIREGKAAIDLLPESRDAAQGAVFESYLARIYARIGEPGPAIDLIEHLVTVPCEEDAQMSIRELQVDWAWDSIREHPRFKKILANPPPDTVYR